MKFYLGTNQPEWLWDGTMDIPLFVNFRRLLTKKNHRPATVPGWALDSGGFMELSTYGRWDMPTAVYGKTTAKIQREIGRLDWAAPQDWMCEPFILRKTGKSVREHQQLTVWSFLQLREMEPEVNWIPVIQGWMLDDYKHHVDMYASYGVDLTSFQTVGIGSVCRRQATKEGELLINQLSKIGLKLHGFGFKTEGLAKVGPMMASADSMAWSLIARYMPPLDGCTHKHCNSCRKWALLWRQQVLQKYEDGRRSPKVEQLELFM